MKKEEIISYLEKSYSDLHIWASNHDNIKFGAGPPGKWNTGQHLDHLIQTAGMITKGLKIPKFILRYKFGRPNRESRDLEKIRSRYLERLASIPEGTPSPTIVRSLTHSDKELVMDELIKASDLLVMATNKWTEKQLDKNLLPHPLMGRMTIREILIWCGYHNYHHLKILKDKY